MSAFAASTVRNRVESIDLLRGTIMIIMALDHVRDYFHDQAAVFDPLDLSQTNTALYFTRWITHFCAPNFMLLSGISAFLVGERKGKNYLTRFLLTRGLWLIFLEFTVVGFGWYFNFPTPALNFLVIWALGASMLVLAAVIHLPVKWIIPLSIVVIAGHNLLDNIHVAGNGAAALGWTLLHQLNIFDFNGHTLFIAYPLVPWVAVMSLGYGVGQLFISGFDGEKRRKILVRTGVTCLLLFVVIRFINVYGDAAPWKPQSSGWLTVLSFLKVSKYPPSLLYLLVTLGPAFLFLAYTEKVKSWMGEQIKMIGRTAMFYYLVHIYLVHLGAMAATYLCGFTWRDMVLDTWISFEPKLRGYGFSLGIVYAVWISLVLLLYFLCRRYDRYKRSHPQYKWLSYL